MTIVTWEFSIDIILFLKHVIIIAVVYVGFIKIICVTNGGIGYQTNVEHPKKHQNKV